MKRVIASIGVILMLVLMAGVAYFAFASPYKLYVVHTGSMDPSIPSGSAVVVRENDYKIGQPVTYTINGQTVTHRLLNIDVDGNITTKGDADRSDDPWHPPKSNIVGGVVASPHYVGFLLVYLRQPTGGPSLLLIPVIFWLLWTSDKYRSEPAPATT